VMLGARMSARSARGWQRFGGLAATALGAVRFASAQDALSRAQLMTLGLRAQAVGPDFDLKAEAVARLPLPDALPRDTRASWLLAASTHEGEDAVVLDAFAASGLTHLILAPRHPKRAPAIAALLADRGLAFARRSDGAEPGAAQVLLADTLGEMDLWYARCGICLIGGTLADKGGHTPWEPARHGCALLHGPSTWNFTRAFADLDAAKGAQPVAAGTLAETLRGLDAATQDRLAAAASGVLQADSQSGALIDRICITLRLKSL
jgi:3-deoxy-D-manno-octulosonic-acid transferase